MKRTLLLLTIAFILGLIPALETNAQALNFGYISYDKVLRSLPEYTTAQNSLASLREQYDKEAQYNEDRFFKQYAEYIQGQKTFPHDIMLKRQKELQVSMDEGIKFRADAEKLLANAEAELLKSVYAKLDNAIATVAKERAYSFVLNTDNHACPFINIAEGTDITSLVELVLAGKPLPKLEQPKPAVAPTPAEVEQAKASVQQVQSSALEQQLVPLTEAK